VRGHANVTTKPDISRRNKGGRGFSSSSTPKVRGLELSLRPKLLIGWTGVGWEAKTMPLDSTHRLHRYRTNTPVITG
jgi:hypothetical protein